MRACFIWVASGLLTSNSIGDEIMFSIRIYCMHPRKGLQVRYITFETFFMAIDCKEILEGKESPGYTVEMYLESSTLTRDALGEILNDRSIECPALINYLNKTI